MISTIAIGEGMALPHVIMLVMVVVCCGWRLVRGPENLSGVGRTG